VNLGKLLEAKRRFLKTLHFWTFKTKSKATLLDLLSKFAKESKIQKQSFAS
jgi:hypothetical protein